MAVQVVVLPRNAFKELEREMRETPGRVQREIRRMADRWHREAIGNLQQDPPKPVYPLNWTSERQRRAFFATDGFGSGIPYQRTGRINDAWTLEDNLNRDLSLRFYNAADYATFVIGEDRQRMHMDTGWGYVLPLLEIEGERFAAGVRDAFFIHGDPTRNVFR